MELFAESENHIYIALLRTGDSTGIGTNSASTMTSSRLFMTVLITAVHGMPMMTNNSIWI